MTNPRTKEAQPVYELTSKKREDFSGVAHFRCVEHGERAGVFRRLSKSGEMFGPRWIFYWDEVRRVS